MITESYFYDCMNEYISKSLGIMLCMSWWTRVCIYKHGLKKKTAQNKLAAKYNAEVEHAILH